jgi:hypothetical protein
MEPCLGRRHDDRGHSNGALWSTPGEGRDDGMQARARHPVVRRVHSRPATADAVPPTSAIGHTVLLFGKRPSNGHDIGDLEGDEPGQVRYGCAGDWVSMNRTHQRTVCTYQPGVHLAVRTETGYRPAMVLQDNGEGEPMVKVRCAVNWVVQDRWVYRVDLIPPPGAGTPRP